MTREEALIKAINIVRYFKANFAKSKEARENATNIIEALEQQPCEDCISRQAVLDAIMANCIWENEYNLTSNRIKKAVESLPSVTPQLKTGRWEYVQYDGNLNIGNWHCSECRSIGIACANKEGIQLYKYCPNCGARMEVED